MSLESLDYNGSRSLKKAYCGVAGDIVVFLTFIS